jgi:hypothetical protein
MNGRWRDILSADQSAQYEQTARDQLGDESAEWLQLL